jgi:16S rRNA (cytosine967-C5)-methyltransferase
LARIDQPRLVAFTTLRRVEADGAYANLELAKQLRQARLNEQDAAFTTELVSGTLRMQGTYDAIIDQLARGSLQPEVRTCLRLGIHQLLSMRVPTHAAVATTVDLVKREVGRAPSGLVNAVLRKVSQKSLEEWSASMPLAQRFSHPEWVVQELARSLDRPEELEALLASNNARPKVTLVARPGLATVDELGGTRSGISPLAANLQGGDPSRVPAVAEGRAGVQDAGSQLVGLLAVAPVVEGDDLWLDLCAGPGGKAALLGALAAQSGTELLANEVSEHRARLVRENLRATGGWVVAGDGRHPAWRRESFSRVLVDAPCSGLGALRRRPESRWRRTPEDVSDLVPLQRELLRTAVESVRPGGVVCYATCSPVVAETSEIVSAALEDLPVRLEDATAFIGAVKEAESVQLPGAIQLWPHRHGTDAMFIALLRRY